MALWQRLSRGLSRTRESLLGPLQSALSGRTGTPELLEKLEEILISADVGVEAAADIVAGLKERLDKGGDLEMALEEIVAGLLAEAEVSWSPPPHRPGVILFVGVNGSGKTTTCAKVAHLLKGEGRSVLIAAADTFRAAAIEQLTELGEEVGAEVITHRAGADPGAVVHDALVHAKGKGYDFVLIDTAGRLQTKRPLMEELGKVCRVVEKVCGRAPDERVLVIDATVGQNAVSQARLFNEAVGLTGLCVTKLDGTAKGGAVIPIWRTLRIPILWVGYGKGLEDLQPFQARTFARALIVSHENS
ncbi:MAG: Signal recognition particle receptor FtsY [Acetothermia bacterium 64_32]|nr:MAG: Signal recognition particle receptor FtsY [Acetothermia bacterium 64_32]HAF70497.1 signal recognition particle-docking protein FtsY [Candidatus Acetothermia bacterium]